MRITTRGRYALRASLALARLGAGGGPVSITRLAEEEDISPVFLEQIFFKLRKRGIVLSVRGSAGGFLFDRPLEHITVKDVLDAAGEDSTSTRAAKARASVLPCAARVGQRRRS